MYADADRPNDDQLNEMKEALLRELDLLLER